MNSRTDWADLPAPVRAQAVAEVGPVVDWEPVGSGLNCRLAVHLYTEDGSCRFVKGVPEDDAHGVAGQGREVAVSRVAAGVVAPVLWSRLCGGWDLLVFQCVGDQHVDLTAGSRDVDLVAETLHRAQGLKATGLAVPRLAERFEGFLDEDGLRLLDGEALLHTDTNPHNMIPYLSQVYLVDWAMAASGPAWVDVAYTAVRLMEAGWPAAGALEWAAGFRSWREADPRAVAAFVSASCRQWEAMVGPVDCRPSNRRFEALLTAVHA
ncbi:aminoglycoside phosphotransferase [Streptomyces sp. SDr-06]|uniref:phosphotransferase n=1 Tax=Streptomyces sp. SDr-06 TaxID=2267702 RepID=UPI000DE8A631|nr:phosphotransferase [Streptomyces sp. SDr-06]RCH70492.1 aminoglycoside phosphotransferase [Streptomyces sp. SDr-06]